MARKPARSKRSRGRKGRKDAGENAKEKATPIWLNPLAIASLVLVLALGGVGAWLTLTFEEPVREPIEIVTDVIALAPPPLRPIPEPEPVAETPATEDAATEPPGIETQPPAETAATPPPVESAAEPPPEERQVAALPPAEEPPPPPIVEENVRMAPAPDPDLVLESENGLLPIIDGERQAWQVYSRPFSDSDQRPRIAILLTSLGLSQAATNAAIQQLPGSVTLGFTPYARSLNIWIQEARAAGHEVFLEIPMEPFDYPASDPGPHTLLTSLPFENDAPTAPFDDNLTRLDWLLSRVTGYVGVTNLSGDKFTSSTESLTPVLESLRDRGLMFLDARRSQTSVAATVASEIELPRALNNRFLDNEASRVAIDARLFELERIAKAEGFAVGIGLPYPVTLERVARWAPTLAGKGIALVPITAVANLQSE